MMNARRRHWFMVIDSLSPSAAQLYMSAVHYDAASTHVTLANHITDATNTYLLAVEVRCGSPVSFGSWFTSMSCIYSLTQAYMKMKRPALASTLLLELATSLEVCVVACGASHSAH